MIISPTINSVHGRLRSITGTDPPAQTNILEVVPERRRWRLYVIKYTLVAGAGGAARSITSFIDDGTNEVWRCTCVHTVLAGETNVFLLSLTACEERVAGPIVHCNMPTLILGPGFRFQTEITNFGADDNLSAPQLLVEEWIDP